jgi:hypothetical protein
MDTRIGFPLDVNECRNAEPQSTLRRNFWRPEEWEGTPTENFMRGMTREEYEAAHPLLYPPKK